jgi:hypothetical protein
MRIGLDWMYSVAEIIDAGQRFSPLHSASRIDRLDNPYFSIKLFIERYPALCMKTTLVFCIYPLSLDEK